MSARTRKLHAVPGNPLLRGASYTGTGCNFTVAVEDGKDASLLLYRRKQKRPFAEISLREEDRIGTVSSVCMEGLEPGSFAYNYRIGGKIVPDPYSRELKGREKFGQELAEDPAILRSVIPKMPKCRTAPLKLPYEEMILYKTHVRGFTKDASSGVKARGTFAGLAEKIPYLKELGINALELMPVYEFFEVPEEKSHPVIDGGEKTDIPKQRINYWGYAAKALYFAPKSSYAASQEPVKEFSELVDALHEAGIECILEFYFGPEITVSFMLDVLHYWQLNFGVDGFHLIGDSAKVTELSSDELLKKTKLIFTGFDPNWVYPDGKAPAFRNLGEHNLGYLETMRRYLKGDEGCIGDFSYYMRRNPKTHGVINYFADHDGFTMADMVSYERKNNLANGDDNTDGTMNNCSWNCGTEGATRKVSVRALRQRQLRNAYMMLMTSQGTPMIYGGDEFMNSQKGNNNAWCQDNPLGWVNWKNGREGEELLQFVKCLIRFRKAHGILHGKEELRLMDYRGVGCPDLSYHSQRAWFSQMENTCRSLGVMYCGAYGGNEKDKTPEDLYIGFNMHWNPHELALPTLAGKKRWYLTADTSAEECFAETGALEIEGKSIQIPPRSVIILTGRQEK